MMNLLRLAWRGLPVECKMPLAVADGMVLESVLARTHLAPDIRIERHSLRRMRCYRSSFAADKTSVAMT